MSKKKIDPKPIKLKEVVIVGKKPVKKKPEPDSVSVGYGAGKKKFADTDIKAAVKAGKLKGVDTTNRQTLNSTASGNSDKADYISTAIKLTKDKKKNK